MEDRKLFPKPTKIADSERSITTRKIGTGLGEPKLLAHVSLPLGTFNPIQPARLLGQAPLTSRKVLSTPDIL